MTESTQCPQCRGEQPANFPAGVCPACLLKQGMSPSTLTGAARDASDAAYSDGASGPERRRSWTPPTPAELAPKFSQLEIAELLGQGGMGAVYKVRQKELDRWAALKILPGEVASDPNFAERFQREARALAQLSHQHIVTVYEFGQRDGVFFLLMEFVDGVTLRQAGRAGQVTAKDALGIVTQLCDALQFAHEEGIVHRDIKPENILIDKRGRVKIADFGLAKLLGKQPNFPTLTGTHQIMGTPVYMAPEQMEGTKGVDHRADIFSLGVVFYELLTGELPLGRFAPPSQKYSLDVRLDEVVLRTLEKEPDRRYQQASDIKLDVESIRSQPVAAGTTKTVKPRRSWSVGKSFVRALVIAMGTFSGLVGTVIFFSWLDQQSRPSEAHRAPIPTASQKAAAIEHYVTEVERQRLDQQRQKQLEEAPSDPLETNAIVQFTADGVKLHPHAFGTDELTAEQRVTVEKILTDIHREYLKAEAAHSESTTEDGFQTATISPFAEDLVKLENALWTAVDTQLPVAVQKLLRQRLPLFADPTVPLPQAATWDMMMSGGSAGGMGAMTPMVPSSGGGPMTGPFGAGGLAYGPTNFNTNLRYQQLLGWRQDQLPFRVTVHRRGKWFRWEIATPDFATFAGGVRQPTGEYSKLDTGEAPELPSGLRRFWQETLTPKSDGQGQNAHASGFNPLQLLIGEDESHEYVMWTNDGVRLSDWIAKAAGLQGDQLAQVNQILTEMHRKYVEVEAKFTEVVLTLEGHQRFTIQAFTKEQTELENELWTKLDAIVTDEKQRTTLHGSLPVFRGGSVGRASKRSPNSPELLGWKPDWNPVVIEVWRKGEWFHWTINTGRVSTGETDGARLPGELARFWRESGSLANPAGSLDQHLLALDKLRAADQTPWDEVKQRANELLAKYTSPADKGRIHWMAAHVYGQSDIRGHGADVIRHAQEALKYERDPVQRCWLYMYLGDATGLVQKKEEAARWYLKGYFELLAFNLPEKAPELPSVGKFRGERFGRGYNEVDPDQIVVEVLQAAEVKARKEAELVRDLVGRRNIYTGQLQNLYGREYTEGSDATVTLKKLATDILRDEAIVTRLIQTVWPDSVPKS